MHRVWWGFKIDSTLKLDKFKIGQTNRWTINEVYSAWFGYDCFRMMLRLIVSENLKRLRNVCQKLTWVDSAWTVKYFSSLK